MLDADEALMGELAESLERTGPVDTKLIAARFHHLKAMGQSAQHCLASFADDKPDTLPIRIGSGVHAIMFNKPVAMWTGKVRNGKAWDMFRIEHDGNVILNRKEHAKSTDIAMALMSHAEASALLFGPGVVHEQTIIWEQLGRSRRSTPDAYGPHHVVELKTTRCAEPNRFCRDGMFRAYHAQLADQMAAIQHKTGKRPAKAYIVAVESLPPHPVTVLELTERALQRGEQLCRLWMERLLVCEQSGSWPGYSQCIEMFDVPDDEVDLVFAAEEPSP